jgi:hypothetical protein
MFKIKGLFRNYLIFITLSLIYTEVSAQFEGKCFERGELVTDSITPCCDGKLVRVTEVGTNNVYCDVEVTEGTVWQVWIMILMFPVFLLIIAIFGIRNRIKLKQANNKATNSPSE